MILRKSMHVFDAHPPAKSQSRRAAVPIHLGAVLSPIPSEITGRLWIAPAKWEDVLELGYSPASFVRVLLNKQLGDTFTFRNISLHVTYDQNLAAAQNGYDLIIQ
ncbi:MAG TPA: hypothetical protein VGS41_17255, partial [Chthonomonadales bacterium]|nr:hypothetical protein [Chthonomonadales bacterium]